MPECKRGFLPDLFCGPKNIAWDWARIASALTLIGYFALAGYKVFAGQEYSLNDFASGAMQILLGSAGIIGAKDLAGAKVS